MPTALRMTATCSEEFESINGPTSTRISKIYHWYLGRCERRPILTKAVSAGIVAGVGAVLSQWIQARFLIRVPLSIDWHHIRSFCLSGLLFEGPFLHVWYEQLFRLGNMLQSKNASSRVQTLAQIAVDQTIGVVLFFPAYFFVYELIQSFLLWRSPQLASVAIRMSTDLVHVIRTNYLVWPVASYIIFRRVPPALRVFVTSLVAVFWNAYLCTRIG